MLVTIRQTKSSGQNLFQVEEQGQLLFQAQTPWADLRLPLEAEKMRRLTFSDAQGQPLYHTSYQLLDNALRSLTKYKFLLGTSAKVEEYQVLDETGQQQGSFYTLIDGLLTSQLTISNAVTIKAGTNAKIRAEGTMRSFGDSIVTVSGVSANFENVAIDAGDQAEYALTYTDGASGTLTGVTVSGGTGSDLLVDGANVTLGSGTSAGQTELAKTGSGTPKLAVQSGSSTKVWVDHDTYTALGMSEDDLEEQLAALVSSESGTVEAVVGTQPGSSAENGTPVTVQPDDADGGDEDDGEESQPEEKTSRIGGDYFGNQKWAELKAQIAKAEDGDTIEMSGTGLPWFPSSVARALKGKDVTLEIRKNGVTYTLNGEKIGLITKLWYNFDENLETTLQPVEE